MTDRLYDFRVCGIDYSTKSVDIVTITYKADDLSLAIWNRLELSRGMEGSPTNLLQIRERLGHVTDWAKVELVYLEDPMSMSMDVAKKLGRVHGAIVASLPLLVREEAVINTVTPKEWKHAFCNDSNASKETVRRRVQQLGFFQLSAGQDAFDAAGVCWAGRELNEQGVARARELAG